MLKTSLSRPLVHRHLSTSTSIWNTGRPRPSNEPAADDDSQVASSSSPHLPNNETPAHTDTRESPSSASDQPKPQDPLAPYDLKVVTQHIREWSENAAIILRTRADDFTASTRTTFSQLGSHLNKVTGYEEIEALKREVVEQEAQINATRQAARQTKIAYDQAVIQRSNSQREVNDLLQRKSTWTDSDLSRFTTLVRQEHLFEQEEIRAKNNVDETEDAVEREFSLLMRSILARYHEEQVWSDKIRSASTYGSLAALGLNMLVFVMAIVVVEPWKRRRLAQTFEKKIEELSLENAAKLDASMMEIGRQLADQEHLLLKVTQDMSRNVHAKLVSLQEGVHEVKTATTEGVEPEHIQSTATTRKRWELAAAASGAFVMGVVGCLLFGR